MFGHNEQGQDSEQSNPTDMTGPTEPVDDGTLGVPTTDGNDTILPSPSANDSPVNTVGSFGVTPAMHTATAPVPVSTSSAHASPTGDDLISIKQQALHQLKPLVGHLEQTSEEKFRTTMMMIQASDDQSLISDAYEAAQGISDEKTRAQALLDVVNEINYFTSQKN